MLKIQDVQVKNNVVYLFLTEGQWVKIVKFGLTQISFTSDLVLKSSLVEIYRTFNKHVGTDKLLTELSKFIGMEVLINC